MIRFTYDENFIYLNGLPSTDNTMLKVHLSADKLTKGWQIALNHHSMSEIYKAYPDLRNNQEFLNLGMEVKRRFDAKLELKKKFRLVGPIESKLRPYQYEDANYLHAIGSGGIFNEPRTGKTPTAIAVMEMHGGFRNLVVCPASLLLNWEKEIKEWWPECTPHVIDTTKAKRPELYREFASAAKKLPSVLIMSKDTWKIDKDVVYEEQGRKKATLAKLVYDTVLVDEAHFLRNSTAQTEAIYKIKADHRYAMTGTPTVNHPSDILGTLHFINPKRFPSYWKFADRYFQVNSGQHSVKPELGWPKPHRKQELQEIVGIDSVQRKRKEVMPWLPPKQFKVISCKMTAKQERLYQEMKTFFTAIDKDDDVEIDVEGVLTQFMRMRQLCLDPRLLDFTEKGSKTVALLDFLENHREPMVVMSMFTSYLKLIEEDVKKLGLKVGMIHGEMSAVQKNNSVVSFQQGKIDILLCNIISAGVGFTLDASRTIIFTDRAWTPAENDQAEDRICPTSEERNHAHGIIDFECVKSVDRRINNILKKKKSLVEYINEGGREAIKFLIGE